MVLKPTGTSTFNEKSVVFSFYTNKSINISMLGGYNIMFIYNLKYLYLLYYLTV